MTTSEIKRIDYAEARRAFDEHKLIPDPNYYVDAYAPGGCHACLIGALAIHLAGRKKEPGMVEMYEALERIGFDHSYLAGLDRGFSYDEQPNDAGDDPAYRAGCTDGRAMRRLLLDE